MKQNFRKLYRKLAEYAYYHFFIGKKKLYVQKSLSKMKTAKKENIK